LKRRYGQLLNATSRVVGQAKRFSEEIAQGAKRATTALRQPVLEGLRQELDEMRSLVRQVKKQTRARIFRGNTRSEAKLLSLFEPSSEVIRKGKAGKPNEFGKMVEPGREPDHYRLRSLRSSAVRFAPCTALGTFSQIERPQRYLDKRGTLFDVGSSI
jgi:hypothetical protein